MQAFSAFLTIAINAFNCSGVRSFNSSMMSGSSSSGSFADIHKLVTCKFHIQMIIPLLVLLMEADSNWKLTFTGSMTGIQSHTNKAITDFL